VICPCNISKTYSECCGFVHKSIFNAKTAEQLMISRYSAFVLDDMNYLKLSHSKLTVKTFNFKSVSKWTKNVNWLKLEILDIENGCEDDVIGYVEFKAFYLENGLIDFIHGHSRFIKENNHWVYLDEK
jgi:SEC-C motif-containing protein